MVMMELFVVLGRLMVRERTIGVDGVTGGDGVTDGAGVTDGDGGY